MKKHVKKIEDLYIWNKKTIGTFFLGVGLTMFILNIVTFINISQYYSGTYLLANYYLSIVSSVVLMSYSLYNIYE